MARTQGAHEGTELLAPDGTRILSITDGTVVLARGSDEDGWNTLGGSIGQGPEGTWGRFEPRLRLGWYERVGSEGIAPRRRAGR